MKHFFKILVLVAIFSAFSTTSNAQLSSSGQIEAFQPPILSACTRDTCWFDFTNLFGPSTPAPGTYLRVRMQCPDTSATKYETGTLAAWYPTTGLDGTVNLIKDSAGWLIMDVQVPNFGETIEVYWAMLSNCKVTDLDPLPRFKYTFIYPPGFSSPSSGTLLGNQMNTGIGELTYTGVVNNYILPFGTNTQTSYRVNNTGYGAISDIEAHFVIHDSLYPRSDLSNSDWIFMSGPNQTPPKSVKMSTMPGYTVTQEGSYRHIKFLISGLDIDNRNGLLDPGEYLDLNTNYLRTPTTCIPPMITKTWFKFICAGGGSPCRIPDTMTRSYNITAGTPIITGSKYAVDSWDGCPAKKASFTFKNTGIPVAGRPEVSTGYDVELNFGFKGLLKITNLKVNGVAYAGSSLAANGKTTGFSLQIKDKLTTTIAGLKDLDSDGFNDEMSPGDSLTVTFDWEVPSDAAGSALDYDMTGSSSFTDYCRKLTGSGSTSMYKFGFAQVVALTQVTPLPDFGIMAGSAVQTRQGEFSFQYKQTNVNLSQATLKLKINYSKSMELIEPIIFLGDTIPKALFTIEGSGFTPGAGATLGFASDATNNTTDNDSAYVYTIPTSKFTQLFDASLDKLKYSMAHISCDSFQKQKNTDYWSLLFYFKPTNCPTTGAPPLPLDLAKKAFAYNINEGCGSGPCYYGFSDLKRYSGIGFTDESQATPVTPTPAGTSKYYEGDTMTHSHVFWLSADRPNLEPVGYPSFFAGTRIYAHYMNFCLSYSKDKNEDIYTTKRPFLFVDNLSYVKIVDTTTGTVIATAPIKLKHFSNLGGGSPTTQNNTLVFYDKIIHNDAYAAATDVNSEVGNGLADYYCFYNSASVLDPPYCPYNDTRYSDYTKGGPIYSVFMNDAKTRMSESYYLCINEPLIEAGYNGLDIGLAKYKWTVETKWRINPEFNQTNLNDFRMYSYQQHYGNSIGTGNPSGTNIGDCAARNATGLILSKDMTVNDPSKSYSAACGLTLNHALDFTNNVGDFLPSEVRVPYKLDSITIDLPAEYHTTVAAPTLGGTAISDGTGNANSLVFTGGTASGGGKTGHVKIISTGMPYTDFPRFNDANGNTTPWSVTYPVSNVGTDNSIIQNYKFPVKYYLRDEWGTKTTIIDSIQISEAQPNLEISTLGGPVLIDDGGACTSAYMDVLIGNNSLYSGSNVYLAVESSSTATTVDVMDQGTPADPIVAADKYPYGSSNIFVKLGAFAPAEQRVVRVFFNTTACSGNLKVYVNFGCNYPGTNQPVKSSNTIDSANITFNAVRANIMSYQPGGVKQITNLCDTFFAEIEMKNSRNANIYNLDVAFKLPSNLKMVPGSFQYGYRPVTNWINAPAGSLTLVGTDSIYFTTKPPAVKLSNSCGLAGSDEEFLVGQNQPNTIRFRFKVFYIACPSEISDFISYEGNGSNYCGEVVSTQGVYNISYNPPQSKSGRYSFKNGNVAPLQVCGASGAVLPVTDSLYLKNKQTTATVATGDTIQIILDYDSTKFKLLNFTGVAPWGNPVIELDPSGRTILKYEVLSGIPANAQSLLIVKYDLKTKNAYICGGSTPATIGKSFNSFTSVKASCAARGLNCGTIGKIQRGNGNALDTIKCCIIPSPTNDYNTTPEDVPVSGNVKTNDTVPVGAKFKVATPPKHGTFVLDSITGAYTYKPDSNWNGLDTVKYQVCDTVKPVPTCKTAFVFLTVTPVNDPPKLQNKPDTTNQGTPKSVCEPFSDPDTANGGSKATTPYSTATSCQGKNGTVSPSAIVGNSICATYTPNPGFFGKDTFCMIVCDGGTPPLCDTIKQAIVVKLVCPVFSNNTLTPVPGICAGLAPNPIIGSVPTSTPFHNFKYKWLKSTTSATAGFAPMTAADTLRDYSPGILTDTVWYRRLVYIDTCPADTARVMVAVNEDCDGDGVPYFKEILDGTDPTDPCSFVTTSQSLPTSTAWKNQDCDGDGVTNGTEILRGTDPNDPCKFTLPLSPGKTPSPAWAALDCDGDGNPNGTDPNPLKPVARDDSTTANVGTPKTISILGNDDFRPNDSNTITKSGGTAAGTVVFDPITGNMTYTAPLSEAGKTVTVEYIVCHKTVCDTALVTIVVPPVTETNPDVNQTFVNTPVTGSVKTNDKYVPGTTYGTPDPIPGNPGTAVPTMNPDGTYTFTSPVPGVFQFNVPVCPPNVTVNCPVELLTITVLDPTKPNNVPVANTDIAATKPNTPVTLNTLANDKSGNDLTKLVPSSVKVTDAPNNGTASVDTVTGNITYTPNPGFVGDDTLKYEVCDNGTPKNCTEAYQIITVLPPGSPNTITATDDYNSGPSTGPIKGNALLNDIDPEGNVKKATPQTTTIPGKGTLVLLADGTYTFTPVPGYNGPVEFPYEVCDSGATPKACTKATIHVLVNDPIKTNPDVNQTFVNTPVTGDLKTNDQVKPGTTYGAPTAEPGNPSPCLPTINSNGTYTFTCDKPGVFQFKVPVCPPGVTVDCPTELLTITVLDPSKADNKPVANTDITSTKENTPVTLKTLANDKSGNDLTKLMPNTVSVVEPPKNGTFTVDTVTGDIKYTPKPGFTGVDTLKYKVCDNGSPSVCAEAYQIIDVLPTSYPNTTVAADDYVSGPSTGPIAGNAKLNDNDPEGNITKITPQTTTVPGKGTIVLKADGSFVFTPVPGYNGPVDFPYEICDSGATPQACTKATIHVLVNDPIKTNPDVNQTFVNTPVTGDLKTNDQVKPGTTYGTPTPVPGNPSSCLPTISPDGKYTFTCDKPGVFQFEVPVCPPNVTVDCPKELLTITVLDPNKTDNVPVANTDITSTKENTPVTLKTLLNDKSGNDLTKLVPSTVSVVDPPNHGTFTVDTVTGDIKYTPNPGFTGIDTLKYKVCDNGNPSVCTEAYQIIDVLPTSYPNTTVAADDYVSGPSTGPITGNAKLNDNDPEGNLTKITPQTTTVPGKGTIVLKADGSFVFTPVPGYNGPVEFPYEICDSGATPQACTKATIHVLVNDPAKTNPDVSQTFVNTPVSGDLTTNDKVKPGTTYGTPTSVPGNPSSCLPTISSDGKYTFTCDKPGVFQFNVPVCPPGVTVDCPTELLTITVLDPNKGNNVPVANTDITSTKENTPVTLKTLLNDKPGNDLTKLVPSSVTVTDPPNNGTFTIDTATGDIKYTPNPGFTGIDTLKYKVCDNGVPVNCSEAYQIIDVLPSTYPNTTVAADDYVSGSSTSPIVGNAKLNDNDPEGNVTKITPQTTTVPGKGTIILKADGSFVFTPVPGYNGPVEFPYEICDSGATPKACTKATIHVLVNDPMKTNPDVNATYVNTPVTGDLTTNDKVKPGTTYGDPSPVPGNPSSCLPTINPDGKYTFTCDKPGVFQFKVPVCPPGVTIDCPTELLTITVLDPLKNNNLPVANTDITTTKENTPVTLKTLLNDKSGNELTSLVPSTVSVVEPPKYGSVTVDTVTGNITYTPNPGFSGIDTLKYKVCDNAKPANCTEAYQIIDILPSTYPNTTVAADDYVSGTSTSPIVGNAKLNDNDPEGNGTRITPQTTTVPGKGTLVLKADGSFVFTPDPTYEGPVEFPYEICDSGTPKACTKATIHVLVKIPTKLNPDVNATFVNVPVTGDLSTNDKIKPGSKYGDPTPIPGNPGTEVPVIDSTGKYTFTSDKPGVYKFNVPVCPPGVTVDCPTELLTITVLDPLKKDNVPVANTDIASTKENTPVKLKTLSNDKSGNELTSLVPSTVKVTDPPKNGTAVVDTLTGDITYTPNPGFTGIDTLKYKVCDNGTPANCAEAFQIITVLPPNAPNTTVAADDYVSGPSTGPIKGNAKTNDTDPEGNGTRITPQVTTVPGKGTIDLKADGSFVFTPVPGYNGPVEFPYESCDSGIPKACTKATIHVLVKDPTKTNPDVNATWVNVPVTGDLKTNDQVRPGTKFGDPTPIPGNPGPEVPKIDSTGKYTFTSDKPGVYKFNVPVCPPGVSINCPTELLTITVLDPKKEDNIPVANTDITTTKENTPVTLKTLANDKSGNESTNLDPSSVTITDPPKNGTATVDPLTGDIKYTPKPGFSGVDTLYYKVCDSSPTPKCVTASQIITVLPKDYPNTTVAADDYVSGKSNGLIVGNAKTNDNDPEGNGTRITPQVTTVPGKGTIDLKADGSFVFTPTPGYNGPVEFPYEICDSGTPVACTKATIHVLVEEYIKSNPDVNTTFVNVPVTGNLATNDQVTPGSKYGSPTPIPGNPNGALPTINPDGTYTFTSDKPGVYKFNVPICPPGVTVNCPTELLTITVLDPAKNNNTPSANTDITSTKMNTPVKLKTLANDKAGNEFSSLVPSTVAITEQPKNGTAVVDPTTGDITYTPKPGFVGLDTLQYKVCDNSTPPQCATAYQIIDVLPPNSPNITVAADDYNSGPSSKPMTGSVLINDSDPEGNTQKVTPQTTTVPGKGTLVLKDDGTYVFTPVPGYNGPVDFPYEVCDNGNPKACAKATLHILVKDDIKLNPDVNATYVNVPVKGNLKTNDEVPVGTKYGSPTPLPGNPNNALPTINPDGTYTFISDKPGVYQFNVPVCPPGVTTNCPMTLLTITVLDPNITTNPIVANTDLGRTKENVPVTLSTLSNDKPGNAANKLVPSSVSIIEQPKNGTAVVDPITGNITYTPKPGFIGKDTLKYRVCDDAVPPICATAYQIIDILPSNAPNITAAADDYNSGFVGQPQTGNVLTNDNDPEGNAKFAVPQTTTIPGKGTLVLNADGTYTFTPEEGFSGPVEFPYTTCDDGTPQACANATLHILVEMPFTVDLPNYFSPNGDGENDAWTIPPAVFAKYPNLKILIYNRWGNIVYRSIGKYTNDWTGQHHDYKTDLPDGVYYYVIELDPAFKTTKTGFVEIMRK